MLNYGFNVYKKSGKRHDHWFIFSDRMGYADALRDKDLFEDMVNGDVPDDNPEVVDMLSHIHIASASNWNALHN